jgi:signal transduction histidine kinase
MIACLRLIPMADRLPTPTRPPSPLASPAPLASSGERRALLGALAAELGHDLQGPLNLFRLSLERLNRGEALDQEDLSLLAEELERLSQLNARLRGLARASLEKIACTPRQLIELALGPRQLEAFALEASDEISFACDPRVLSQALRELIDNALAARTARAGVRFEQGQTPGFCVWDDGAGFELSAEAALAWGATTRPLAAGLGLTLALRAARAHGFNLELRRVPPHTEAWLLLPARELTPPVTP